MSYLPKDEILESINGCDVGLISLMPGMAGVSVPGRIYELWAAGKPVIVVADENSELALMTNEDKLGWVVPPRNTNALVQAIQEAKSNRPLLSEMGFRARRIAEQKYARGKQIDAYCALISSLLCAK
jgi:glycosyltransferase involved in cell wall biosynthesis